MSLASIQQSVASFAQMVGASAVRQQAVVIGPIEFTPSESMVVVRMKVGEDTINNSFALPPGALTPQMKATLESQFRSAAEVKARELGSVMTIGSKQRRGLLDRAMRGAGR
jgi:hypothetical protein